MLQTNGGERGEGNVFGEAIGGARRGGEYEWASGIGRIPSG